MKEVSPAGWWGETSFERRRSGWRACKLVSSLPIKAGLGVRWAGGLATCQRAGGA